MTPPGGGSGGRPAEAPRASGPPFPVSPQGAVVELLGIIREVLGAESCAIWRVTPGAGANAAAVTLAQYASGDGKPPALDATGAGLVTWVAAQESLDVSTDGDRPRFGAALVPEVTHGSPSRTVLTVGSSQRGRLGIPRDQLRRWLPRYARELAIVASLVEARGAADRAERNADLILVIAAQLHEHRTVEELGEAICAAASHMTGARRVAVVRWSSSDERGEVAYATRGHLVGPDWPVDAMSQVGLACRGDRTILIEDAAGDGDVYVVYGGSEPPRSLGSLAIIPLGRSQRVIGALVVEGDTRGQITEGDGKHLRLLALLATATLETVWEIEEINRRARTDALTGLANRRQFEERLERIVAETNRFGGSCALVVIDIDRFKHVNDTYGHRAGDDVLRRVALLLQQAVRVVDLCARYGGEEMALLLPQTDLEGAVRLAERLRESVAARPIHASGHEVSITISLGVAAYPEGARDGDELFAAADRALYDAKRLGRNRVVADRA